MRIFTLDPSQKSLREVQQILNSTEGNFHQLVALLNCRGLNKVKKDAAVPELQQPVLDHCHLLSCFCVLLLFTFAGLHRLSKRPVL